MDLSGIGRVLLILAAAVAAVGLLMLLLGKLGLPRLPGDIAIERGNTRFYFPLGPSILVSVVLTVLLNLLVRR